MMPLPCRRLLMTGSSMSFRTQPVNQLAGPSSLAIFSKDYFAEIQPIPYVYPHAFDFKVAFDWIYLICLRILLLLSRLMFAIPAIVNVTQSSVTGCLL